MKQTMKRLGALGLALLLGALGSIPALAAELPEKDEVIYVNLSPEGEAGAIYVVNSYDLPAETTVTDYGNYRRVKNLTTTAPLTQEGKKITFTAPAGKFYYQGELDSARTGELPWRVAVRYFLDGKETPGQELAGASGRLEMRVSLRQNPEADPVWRDNYALQTTILLDTESCKNIVAEGATLADVGQKKQMSYIILPGKEKDFTITADVVNFEMDGISVNGIPLVLDIDDPDTQELKDQISDLQDGAAQLDDGALALSDGVDELEYGAEALRDGAESLQSGMRDLNASLQMVGQGMGKLEPLFPQLIQGAVASGALSPQEAQKIGGMLEQLPLLLQGSSALAAGADQLANGTDDLYDGVLKLKDGVAELSDGTMQLRDQSSDMDTQVDDKVDEMLDEYRSKDFAAISFVDPENPAVAAVQFVIKTGDIKLPEAEAPVQAEEPKETFWQRVQDLFPSRKSK